MACKNNEIPINDPNSRGDEYLISGSHRGSLINEMIEFAEKNPDQRVKRIVQALAELTEIVDDSTMDILLKAIEKDSTVKVKKKGDERIYIGLDLKNIESWIVYVHDNMEKLINLSRKGGEEIIILTKKLWDADERYGTKSLEAAFKSFEKTNIDANALYNSIPSIRKTKWGPKGFELFQNLSEDKKVEVHVKSIENYFRNVEENFKLIEKIMKGEKDEKTTTNKILEVVRTYSIYEALGITNDGTDFGTGKYDPATQSDSAKSLSDLLTQKLGYDVCKAYA
jgi:hypothetical protein